jgi:hypothetical protein
MMKIMLKVKGEVVRFGLVVVSVWRCLCGLHAGWLPSRFARLNLLGKAPREEKKCKYEKRYAKLCSILAKK